MGRKRTPEEEARRELIRELLSKSNVTSMEDIQKLFKETIAEFMEDSLGAELGETLGYGKYDHTARTESGTTNSRNGHSRKTLKTSAGKIDINIPRDRNASLSREYSPRIRPASRLKLRAKLFRCTPRE